MKRARVMEAATYVIVFLAMWIISPLSGKLLDRLYYPYPRLLSSSTLILLVGVILAILGLSLVLWTIIVFKTLGRGTPNPKLPPTELVVRGPYRYSRNPMALGGFLFLLGEAGIYQSPSLAVMAGLFLIILYFNAMYVEEPELRRRYGLPYEKYCQAVPRFLPKLMRRHAMGGPMEPVQFDWARMRNIQKIHRLLYAIGLGPLVGKIVLLLTTTGRRSGKKRVTPLQYEVIDGFYYLGAARGLKADWLRNLQANPQVEIRVGAKHVWGCAEVVTDPAKFADFMEVRLERHPRMIGLIMEKAHGLPRHPSREQLEALAANEAMVIVRPLKD